MSKVHRAEVKSAVSSCSESESTNAIHWIRDLHIDDHRGGHREPHIVRVGVVGILRVPHHLKILGKSHTINVHKYRNVHKYVWLFKIPSTVDGGVDQDLGRSIWDGICNAVLIRLCRAQVALSDKFINGPPN